MKSILNVFLAVLILLTTSCQHAVRDTEPDLRSACKDLGAVPQAIELLNSNDPKIRHEAIMVLKQLITPEGINALEDFAFKTKDPNEAKICQHFVDSVFADLKLSHDDWKRRSPQVQKDLVKTLDPGRF
jgi:hypothetical protein